MPSENGWNPARVSTAECEWVRIPGAEHVSLQILKGWPLQVMRAYAADYHAYIEPLRDADSASYTPTNSVATSNHLNGTAMDLNWNSHPFRVDYAGFDGPKIQRMRELLDFYTFDGLKIMFWAQDWKTPKDAMHHQMGYGTYGDARVGRFIAERIRPDGFSTYKRGGTVPSPPPPPANAVSVLRRAMEQTGVSDATLASYLPHFSEAMRAAEINTVRRAAAWCSQIGHESAGLKYMAEIQTDGPGWTEDRRIYRGRGPIQLTWSSNYRKFGQWCVTKGYITDPELFVKQPTLVEQPRWGFLAASWYWLSGGPRPGQINGFADAGDILSVSKCVNGWVATPNGMPDRQVRYNRALALGDQLLTLTTTTTAPPTQGDDELSAEAERMIREMHAEWSKDKRGPSRSFLATDGAGVESPLGFLYNIDGNVWTQQLTWAYLFDVPLAIDVVTSVARTGVYEGSWVKTHEANAWLNEFGQAYCQGLINFKNALAAKLTSRPATATPAVSAPADTRELADAYAANAQLTAENSQLRLAATQTPAALPAVPAETGLGDVVKTIVDAVEQLKLADALTIQDRATLAASIKILEMKNGSQI